jgi:hypothetical protein
VLAHQELLLALDVGALDEVDLLAAELELVLCAAPHQNASQGVRHRKIMLWGTVKRLKSHRHAGRAE